MFENMQESLSGILPGLTDSFVGVFGALITLIIGWFIAKAISKLVYRILKGTKWDEKLLGSNVGKMDMNTFISKIVYYLLMIMVLMIVLNMLGVDAVLDPLKDMVGQFFGYIPNIIAAGIIGFIGYILATFSSEAIGMGGSLIDGWAKKLKFQDTAKLTSIIKNFIFAVIVLLFSITALDVLNIEAISGPAKAVLTQIFDALPNILAAVIIISLFLWGGKFIAGMLKDLFKSMGVDDLSAKLDLGEVIGSGTSLSGLMSNLVYFFIAFFGVMTGVEALGFDQLTSMMNRLLEMSGGIVFGLVLLVAGNFISKIASNAVGKGGNKFLSSVVRVTTLALFMAIALRSMGIANSIIDLAFGLTLGAVAVAVALAYGLGGREAAGEHMKEILGKLK